MKGRNAQVSRVYKILTILEGAPHGLSVSDLADRLSERGFEVAKRTVYRDLDALRGAGFPLEERGKSEDNGTRWTLERTTKISHYLVLSARELLALYLARSALSPLKETPFFEDLNSTFHKIEEKLGDKSQSYLQELSADFHFEPGPRWGLGLDPDVMDTVRSACTERQVLSVVYYSVNSGKTSERHLGPQFLYFAKGSLYLVAEDLDSKIVKVFSVPRMSQAKMLDEEYQGENVDPERYFASAFGIYRGNEAKTVRLRVGQKIAAYVKERRWHESQRVVGRENGVIELSFDVDVTPELVQWILGFGANIEVLEPVELMERIREEARSTVELYQGKKEAG